MLKIGLIYSIIINLLSINNRASTVDKVEWQLKENAGAYAYLNITINCPKRDIITLKIKSNDKEYESSLIIEGKKETKAKILLNEDKEHILSINVFSQNKNDQIGDFDFPIYFINNQKCYLNKSKSCYSKYPSKVIYQNGKIKEYNEVISLNVFDLNLNSFNNLIPIKRLSFYTKNIEMGDAYLYLKKQYENIQINYNNQYEFPLDIIKKDNLMTFEFSTNYYIDDMNGITYEDYKINTRIDNNILMPYVDETYEFQLIVYDLGAFESVSLDFSVNTKGSLIGKENSKYRIKRNYL